jgi:hypothetical protein
MQYVMLIYQGAALGRQAALPDEEQKQVYADYRRSTRRPASPRGCQWAFPATRPPCASKAAR